MSKYIHGVESAEQRRLIAQAEYWRDTLILPDLPYRDGESLLDIGCGVGAVLGVLATAHPGLRLAGIDQSEAQVVAAREHLEFVPGADLRVGDALDLPWPDGSFDHVYIMWFLEHLPGASKVLAEARRVLRPGGTITINETDYSTLLTAPENADLQYLAEAQRLLFAQRGCAITGRSLGPWLVDAGFREVISEPLGFHFFADGSTRMRDFVDYLLGFMEPMVPVLAEGIGADQEQLGRALQRLRELPEQASSSITQLVFRARGLR